MARFPNPSWYVIFGSAKLISGPFPDEPSAEQHVLALERSGHVGYPVPPVMIHRSG